MGMGRRCRDRRLSRGRWRSAPPPTVTSKPQTAAMANNTGFAFLRRSIPKISWNIRTFWGNRIANRPLKSAAFWYRRISRDRGAREGARLQPSILGCVYQNRRNCSFIRWSSDVIAIEFGQPERGASTSPRCHTPHVLVMVSILLVIDINKAGRQLSSPRDVYTLPRRIKIDAVHPVRGWKVSDFLARLGVHDNHFGRSAGADEQARGRLVEGSVAWALAAYLPSRNYLPFVRVDYLDLVGNGNEHKKRRSRPVQQKLRGVGHNFDIADALVFLCVDDSNLSVVLPCVLTTVTDIDKFRMRFVDDAVGPTVKLDRVKKIERVAPKDSEHPVIPACHK